ncbi:hypothetical protein [Uliginosibacterium flavum]|uniref:Lipoprotein n=1 Tax=Uliginosibacterium flavum TaxID=1396831 RepID=A0ABV2TQU3_9RHOO
MKTAVLFLFLMNLTGCTTEAWYEGSRQSAEARCRSQPPSEFDRCMAQVNRQPYEDYEKARKAPKPQ